MPVNNRAARCGYRVFQLGPRCVSFGPGYDLPYASIFEPGLLATAYFRPATSIVTTGGNPLWRGTVAVIGLLLLGELLLGLAAKTNRPVDIDIGPSTGEYLTGFTDSEERPGLSFRWTQRRADISTSLIGEPGDGSIVLRYGRFLDQTARVRVYVGGQAAGSFDARPGRFRIHRIPFRFDGMPLRVELLAEDPAREELGIAVDWVRLEGSRASLPLTFWPPRLLVIGVFLIGLGSGISRTGAFGVSLALAAVQAVWFALDPFGMAHVSQKIVLRAVVLSGVAIVFSRFISDARDRQWIPLLFLVGYLLKGSAIFYPSFFSPDVLTHGRYVLAFPSDERGLEERGVVAQQKSNIAYPRNVGGQSYAFPYSPLFYLPFTGLRDRAQVDEALKYAALAAAAAEVIVIYWLASIWLGTGNGLLAAVLATFMPVTYNRLFLAMWPTTWGHLLDLLTITSAALLAFRPTSLRLLAVFSALNFASFLTYVSSLFNLTAFSTLFSLLQRRLAPILACAAAAVIAIGVLYSSFTWTFVSEILPNLGGSGTPAGGVGFTTGIALALRRPLIFYDFGYLALAGVGMVLIYRKREPLVFRPMLAYFLTFVSLLALRALSGGLFKDLKEILFLAPLVAITSSASILEIARRHRAGKLAAAMIVFGLLIFWGARYRDDLQTFCSLAGLSR